MLKIDSMSKPSINNSDADHQPMSEPTKYIIRCCELRKRRQGKPSLSPAPVRIRVVVGN